MLTQKITPMAWAPLGGIFSEETTPQKKRILDQLESLAAKLASTKNQIWQIFIQPFKFI